MIKSALGIAVSVVALLVAAPAAQAATSSATKTSSKKHSVKKSHARYKAGHAHHASARTSSGSSKAAKTAHGNHKSGYQHVAFSPAPEVHAAPPVMTAGDLAGLNLTHDPLALRSNAAVVIDQATSQVLFDKNSAVALPIASLTKLMTATIVVEAHQNMDEVLEVTSDDIDRERNSTSRLRVGSKMTRSNMLHIALMSSENRAASALGRNYPGGLPAFVAAMNAKAKALGMNDTRYVDSTGLSSQNVSSARDLSRLVVAAYQHPIIREYSTDTRYVVDTGGHRQLQYINSNRLVMNPGWEIGLQKTGYIAEAGRCLLMQTTVNGRRVVMVFLDSKGKDSRLADAGRVRRWLEISKPQALTPAAAHQG
ncbi:D-alanyl-D-alanine endopeptidase [Noviherbaspirillum sp.]|uniref:D-alanyl-D-alanine endopeptidase n=2 Tax=Burkholderiales TaxID=80840 RepID=UPI0010A32FE3|nr:MULTISPECIES: D-alanyl-D-alanine endopeptidase [Oxalobacteraceae]